MVAGTSTGPGLRPGANFYQQHQLIYWPYNVPPAVPPPPPQAVAAAAAMGPFFHPVHSHPHHHNGHTSSPFPHPHHGPPPPPLQPHHHQFSHTASTPHHTHFTMTTTAHLNVIKTSNSHNLHFNAHVNNNNSSPSGEGLKGGVGSLIVSSNPSSPESTTSSSSISSLTSASGLGTGATTPGEGESNAVNIEKGPCKPSVKLDKSEPSPIAVTASE